MSYGTLFGTAKKKICLAHADVADLQRYGITEQWLDEFSTMVDEALNIEMHSSSISLQRAMTIKRDKARDALHLEIMSLMVRVQARFGLKSAEYERFNTAMMSRKTDAEFLVMARHICAEATRQLPALAIKNVTQADIDILENLTQQFSDAIDRQVSEVAARDAKTQQRIESANAIYARLVELTSFAKTHYFGRDAVRYKHYLIYK